MNTKQLPTLATPLLTEWMWTLNRLLRQTQIPLVVALPLFSSL
jgi:hypothetical protein